MSPELSDKESNYQSHSARVQAEYARVLRHAIYGHPRPVAGESMNHPVEAGQSFTRAQEFVVIDIAGSITFSGSVYDHNLHAQLP